MNTLFVDEVCVWACSALYFLSWYFHLWNLILMPKECLFDIISILSTLLRLQWFLIFTFSQFPGVQRQRIFHTCNSCKPTILVSQKPHSLPFPLRHINCKPSVWCMCSCSCSLSVSSSLRVWVCLSAFAYLYFVLSFYFGWACLSVCVHVRVSRRHIA